MTTTAPPRTYVAVLETWEPTTRTQRTIETRQLDGPYRDATTLINEAEKLCPLWQPHFINVYLVDEQPEFVLSYGADEGGVQTSVRVIVDLVDALIVAAHVLTRTHVRCALINADMPRRKLGGGGEELSVPTIVRATVRTDSQPHSIH